MVVSSDLRVQGLWQDSQIEPLKRIVNFCHAHGTLVGVQLTHGGRKTSTYAPFVHLNATKTKRATKWVADKDEGGWPDDGECFCLNDIKQI